MLYMKCFKVFLKQLHTDLKYSVHDFGKRLYFVKRLRLLQLCKCLIAESNFLVFLIVCIAYAGC